MTESAGDIMYELFFGDRGCAGARAAGLMPDVVGEQLVEPQAEPVKVQLLREVMEIVGKRGLNYGTPENNFERIARRWSVHLLNRYGVEGPEVLDELDVAMMCIDLKLARLENEELHMDSWKDICGYGACGGEIAQGRISRGWAEAANEDAKTLDGVSEDQIVKMCEAEALALKPIAPGDSVAGKDEFGETFEGIVYRVIEDDVFVDVGDGWRIASIKNCVQILSNVLRQENNLSRHKSTVSVR